MPILLDISRKWWIRRDSNSSRNARFNRVTACRDPPTSPLIHRKLEQELGLEPRQVPYQGTRLPLHHPCSGASIVNRTLACALRKHRATTTPSKLKNYR